MYESAMFSIFRNGGGPQIVLISIVFYIPKRRRSPDCTNQYCFLYSETKEVPRVFESVMFSIFRNEGGPQIVLISIVFYIPKRRSSPDCANQYCFLYSETKEVPRSVRISNVLYIPKRRRSPECANQ